MRRRRATRLLWIQLIAHIGRHGSRHCVLLRRRGKPSIAYVNDQQLCALKQDNGSAEGR